ncbi:AMP-dependent synthetase [Colwellia sp. 75C3]|uniref:AMP-binding protein n=1 Tax=Colwellia sp. 75C3 TaxID=888425 RepID=UPI000C335A4B|nr:AMP-binding protein [Colwellia sp. 75C3]PKG82511.1 AMP-dependent synthetase [Colwellia sp. 75C3]
MKFPNQSSHFIEQGVSFSQWQQQVICLKDKLSEQPQQTWLLFCQDSYLFSLYFFALVAANKRVVLPPNGQSLQLQQCMVHADIFLGDCHESQGIDNNDLVDEYPCFDIASLKCLLAKEANSPVTGVKLVLNPESDIVFFTSGSSGQAKAIYKKFNQLIIEVEQLEKTFCSQLDNDEGESALVMATVSHQHIYGLLFKLLWPLWSGRDLYLQAFAYPEHLVQKIKQLTNRNICLISSPAYYHRLLNDNVLREVRDQLQVLFSSGGPLNAAASIDLHSELNIRPIEVFGSTETGGIAWRQRVSLDDENWQVFSEIQFSADDETQRLAILSPYVNRQQWYETDDRVELIDKQRFKLLGRADRIVKIEEKRCSLDELGARLTEHEWIAQAYVLVHEQVGKRRCLAAVAELSSAGQLAFSIDKKFTFDRQLKTFLKQYFEAIVVPRKFRYLEQLPYNSQGKLNKKHLESLFD